MANILNVSTLSDGSSGKWPNTEEYTKVDNVQYLTKLATKWAKDLNYDPNLKYTLDRLPNGYALYGKYRNNDPNHVRYIIFCNFFFTLT